MLCFGCGNFCLESPSFPRASTGVSMGLLASFSWRGLPGGGGGYGQNSYGGSRGRSSSYGGGYGARFSWSPLVGGIADSPNPGVWDPPRVWHKVGVRGAGSPLIIRGEGSGPRAPRNPCAILWGGGRWQKAGFFFDFPFFNSYLPIRGFWRGSTIDSFNKPALLWGVLSGWLGWDPCPPPHCGGVWVKGWA